MHETSLVAELVEECARRAHGHRVAAVLVRRANSLDAESLQALFSMLTTEGPLAGAALEAESFAVHLHCPGCGFDGEIDDDHIYGHARVCPACGLMSDDDGSAELELLDVVLSP